MTTPFTFSYSRGILLTVALVLAITFVISLASFGGVMRESPKTFALGFILVASGPIGGWITAAQDGSIRDTLWSLLPLTALAFGPLFVAVYRPASRRACFAVVASAWIIAGYYYGFAMWI